MSLRVVETADNERGEVELEFSSGSNTADSAGGSLEAVLQADSTGSRPSKAAVAMGPETFNLAARSAVSPAEPFSSAHTARFRTSMVSFKSSWSSLAPEDLTAEAEIDAGAES